jgi:hypothetical protein
MSFEVSALSARPDIVDQFGRTSASGWGTADTGQAWTVGSGGAEYSVGSGSGVMDFGGVSTRIARMALANTDSDVQVDISLPVTPTGAKVDVVMAARRSASASTDYRVAASFGTDGNVSIILSRFLAGVGTTLGTVVASTAYAPGATYRVRLRCVGSTIQAKAWLTSVAEPAAWGVSAVDTNIVSGDGFLLATIPAPSNSSSDPRALFDNFSVRALYPNVVDSFARTVAPGGWGAADSGHGWVLTGTASDFSVSGGLGRIAPGSANQSRSAAVSFSHMDVDQVVDIGAAQVQTGDSTSAYMWARVNSAGNAGYRVVATFLTNGSLAFDLNKVVSGSITLLASSFATLSYTANEMFRIRLQCVGSTIRVKTWPAVDPEPSSWTVSVTDSDVTSGVSSVCQVFRRSSSTSADPTVLFDNFFVRPLRPAINDSFDRTVASGWGELTSGQAWINSDTATSSVGSGRGVQAPAANAQTVNSIAAPSADVEVRAVLDFAQVPTGGTVGAQLQARAAQTSVGGDRYQLAIVLDTSGNISASLSSQGTTVASLATVLGSTAYTPGTGINMRLRCVGSKIMGKAWIVGQAEPAWTEATSTVYTSAGFVRCNTSTASGNTSTDKSAYFDDFQVIDLSRPLKLDTGVTSIDPSRLVTI